jgi:hypothetical protein
MTDNPSEAPPANGAGSGPTAAVVPRLLTAFSLMALVGLRPAEVAHPATATVITADPPQMIIDRWMR